MVILRCLLHISSGVGGSNRSRLWQRLYINLVGQITVAEVSSVLSLSHLQAWVLDTAAGSSSYPWGESVGQSVTCQ